MDLALLTYNGWYAIKPKQVHSDVVVPNQESKKSVWKLFIR